MSDTVSDEEVLKTDLHIQAAYRLTEALVSSEKKMRRRIELLSEVVFETDGSRILRFLNRAWTDILGYDMEFSLGSPLDRYLHSEDRPLLVDYLATGNGSRRPLELRLIAKNGDIVLMEMSTTPLEEGGMVGTLFNVTQRNLMQHDLSAAKDAAERASQAKSVFLAAMSHEIRTPLNGVLGMVSLLLEGTLDDTQRQRANIIKNSGEALVTIVNDILDYSKIESGRFSLTTEHFYMKQVLDDTINLFRGNAESKGIKLSGSFDGDAAICVTGDRGRLRQVMMNLVSNAVKFTAQGKVEVHVTQVVADGLAQIVVPVKDTGIGVAPEDMNRLFVHFSQVDGSATRKQGGTGLGLAISKQLVEMMGGQIGVETRIGEGSTFWFNLALPVAQPSERPSQPQAVAEGFAFHGLRGLIAEDNIVNQLVLKGVLDALGCEVDIAANGREAVDSVRKSQYDFVLMDVHMPDMDGLEATREIRRTSNVPVVAVTANVLPEHIQVCYEAGMDGFIPKPISRQTIEAELTRVLTTRHVAATVLP